MTGADAARRLVQDLRAAAKIRGHGTLTRTLRACGKSDDYLHNVAAERMPLGTFLDLLDHAGLKLEARASRALDDDDPVTRFIADARQIRAEYRMPPLLDQARRQGAAGKAHAGDEIDLEGIDDLRYHSPHRAARKAARAVRAARGPMQVASALGVWASCQRMCYRLDWASGAIGLAFEIAEVGGDRAAETGFRCLQRACPALRDRGELDFAVSLAEQVIAAWFRRGNLELAAKALVDLSVMLIDSDETEDAGRVARTALQLLDSTDVRNRAAAWSVISKSHLARDDFQTAAEAAQKAAYWAQQTKAVHLIGRVHWIRGWIAARQLDFEAAEKHYIEALEALGDAAFDAVLVGAELVRVMLRNGRPAKAAEIAAALRWFEEPLSRDPLDVDRALVGGLVEMATAGEEARLTVQVVDRALQRLRIGMKQRTNRLRSRLRP